jgi:hypothetical protein
VYFKVVPFIVLAVVISSLFTALQLPPPSPFLDVAAPVVSTPCVPLAHSGSAPFAPLTCDGTVVCINGLVRRFLRAHDKQGVAIIHREGPCASRAHGCTEYGLGGGGFDKIVSINAVLQQAVGSSIAFNATPAAIAPWSPSSRPHCSQSGDGAGGNEKGSGYSSSAPPPLGCEHVPPHRAVLCSPQRRLFAKRRWAHILAARRRRMRPMGRLTGVEEALPLPALAEGDFSSAWTSAYTALVAARILSGLLLHLPLCFLRFDSGATTYTTAVVGIWILSSLVDAQWARVISAKGASDKVGALRAAHEEAHRDGSLALAVQHWKLLTGLRMLQRQEHKGLAVTIDVLLGDLRARMLNTAWPGGKMSRVAAAILKQIAALETSERAESLKSLRAQHERVLASQLERQRQEMRLLRRRQSLQLFAALDAHRNGAAEIAAQGVDIGRQETEVERRPRRALEAAERRVVRARRTRRRAACAQRRRSIVARAAWRRKRWLADFDAEEERAEAARRPGRPAGEAPASLKKQVGGSRSKSSPASPLLGRQRRRPVAAANALRQRPGHQRRRKVKRDGADAPPVNAWTRLYASVLPSEAAHGPPAREASIAAQNSAVAGAAGVCSTGICAPTLSGDGGGALEAPLTIPSVSVTGGVEHADASPATAAAPRRRAADAAIALPHAAAVDGGAATASSSVPRPANPPPQMPSPQRISAILAEAGLARASATYVPPEAEAMRDAVPGKVLVEVSGSGLLCAIRALLVAGNAQVPTDEVALALQSTAEELAADVLSYGSTYNVGERLLTAVGIELNELESELESVTEGGYLQGMMVIALVAELWGGAPVEIRVHSMSASRAGAGSGAGAGGRTPGVAQLHHTIRNLAAREAIGSGPGGGSAAAVHVLDVAFCPSPAHFSAYVALTDGALTGVSAIGHVSDSDAVVGVARIIEAVKNANARDDAMRAESATVDAVDAAALEAGILASLHSGDNDGDHSIGSTTASPPVAAPAGGPPAPPLATAGGSASAASAPSSAPSRPPFVPGGGGGPATASPPSSPCVPGDALLLPFGDAGAALAPPLAAGGAPEVSGNGSGCACVGCSLPASADAFGAPPAVVAALSFVGGGYGARVPAASSSSSSASASEAGAGSGGGGGGGGSGSGPARRAASAGGNDGSGGSHRGGGGSPDGDPAAGVGVGVRPPFWRLPARDGAVDLKRAMDANIMGLGRSDRVVAVLRTGLHALFVYCGGGAIVGGVGLFGAEQTARAIQMDVDFYLPSTLPEGANALDPTAASLAMKAAVVQAHHHMSGVARTFNMSLDEKATGGVFHSADLPTRAYGGHSIKFALRDLIASDDKRPLCYLQFNALAPGHTLATLAMQAYNNRAAACYFYDPHEVRVVGLIREKTAASMYKPLIVASNELLLATQSPLGVLFDQHEAVVASAPVVAGLHVPAPHRPALDVRHEAALLHALAVATSEAIEPKRHGERARRLLRAKCTAGFRGKDAVWTGVSQLLRVIIRDTALAATSRAFNALQLAQAAAFAAAARCITAARAPIDAGDARTESAARDAAVQVANATFAAAAAHGKSVCRIDDGNIKEAARFATRVCPRMWRDCDSGMACFSAKDTLENLVLDLDGSVTAGWGGDAAARLRDALLEYVPLSRRLATPRRGPPPMLGGGLLRAMPSPHVLKAERVAKQSELEELFSRPPPSEDARGAPLSAAAAANCKKAMASLRAEEANEAERRVRDHVAKHYAGRANLSRLGKCWQEASVIHAVTITAMASYKCGRAERLALFADALRTAATHEGTSDAASAALNRLALGQASPLHANVPVAREVARLAAAAIGCVFGKIANGKDATPRLVLIAVGIESILDHIEYLRVWAPPPGARNTPRPLVLWTVDNVKYGVLTAETAAHCDESVAYHHRVLAKKRADAAGAEATLKLEKDAGQVKSAMTREANRAAAEAEASASSGGGGGGSAKRKGGAGQTGSSPSRGRAAAAAAAAAAGGDFDGDNDGDLDGFDDDAIPPPPRSAGKARRGGAGGAGGGKKGRAAAAAAADEDDGGDFDDDNDSGDGDIDGSHHHDAAAPPPRGRGAATSRRGGAGGAGGAAAGRANATASATAAAHGGDEDDDSAPPRAPPPAAAAPSRPPQQLAAEAQPPRGQRRRRMTRTSRRTSAGASSPRPRMSSARTSLRRTRPRSTRTCRVCGTPATTAASPFSWR